MRLFWCNQVEWFLVQHDHFLECLTPSMFQNGVTKVLSKQKASLAIFMGILLQECEFLKINYTKT